MCTVSVDIRIESVSLSNDGKFLIVIERQGGGIYAWQLLQKGDKIEDQLLWRIPKRYTCKGLKIHPRGALSPEQDLSPQIEMYCCN